MCGVWLNTAAKRALLYRSSRLEGRADFEWVIRKLRLDLLPTLIVDTAFWFVVAPTCSVQERGGAWSLVAGRWSMLSVTYWNAVLEEKKRRGIINLSGS